MGKCSVSVDEAEKKLLTNPGLFLLAVVLLVEKRDFVVVVIAVHFYLFFSYQLGWAYIPISSSHIVP